MFRIPYRWSRAPLKNLAHCWWDFRNGIRNLWRWLPVIWFDCDWDWIASARILEIKLRRLADSMNGRHVGDERRSQQARTCAALLKRMMADEYFENAEMFGRRDRWTALQSIKTAANDQRYFGLLMGKYFRNWWD